MTERQNVRVNTLNRSIYGSLTNEKKYESDLVSEVILWLQVQLAELPPEHRRNAHLEIESVGGYEGEHHAEVSIYYDRPETDQEMAARIAKRKRYLEDEVARHAGYAEQAKRNLKQL